ncbi:MAG: Gfo/Idh/MocA family oxidoreductase [Mesorhizobium sp.]|uniref:Gfo/Idh/MocA family protein n=1 Tax=Mesorhizobium sp. TaxID=1871066 RepID=UPI0011FFFB45|nr:Gfo/Idh/MocA family oxidoreductase [Mesorhizobium sp.]TIM26978.1 MAG: Gfo/Idh/MocA family oxidoreductase [Mesorhizobium sp.]
MISRIPIAVIGCGYWGSKHVRIALGIPSVRLVWAVDVRQDRLNYIRSEYNRVAVSRSFDSILTSDVAGVVIATPISTHFELAKAALEAGKNVLIEKPMAMTSAECRTLIAISERKSLILMVGHTFEYHPAVRFMEDVIKRGGLGDLHYISSRRLNLGLYQSDTNVLWDLAPHDFSIIFSLLGNRVEKIDAWGCAHVFPDVEDVAYAMVKFSGGVKAHLHVSWLDPVKVRQVTVVGSEGMLVFDDVLPAEKVRVYDKCFKPTTTNGDSYADFVSAYHHGDVHIPSIAVAEPLRLEFLDFVTAISTGKQPRADGRSGLRVVQALEAASKRIHHQTIIRSAGKAPPRTVLPPIRKVAAAHNPNVFNKIQ